MPTVKRRKLVFATDEEMPSVDFAEFIKGAQWDFHPAMVAYLWPRERGAMATSFHSKPFLRVLDVHDVHALLFWAAPKDGASPLAHHLGGRTVRCVRAVRKVGCFPPPVATGPRVLSSAPPMLVCIDRARFCRGVVLQGCSWDKQRNNWRRARAVRTSPLV